MWASDPSLFGKNLCSCGFIFPFLDCLPEGVVVWSGHIVSLSSLPFSLWFLLYILSFGKIFSAGLQIVLIDSFSVISCKFRVPM